jgi:hypothetical protein
MLARKTPTLVDSHAFNIAAGGYHQMTVSWKVTESTYDRVA